MVESSPAVPPIVNATWEIVLKYMNLAGRPGAALTLETRTTSIRTGLIVATSNVLVSIVTPPTRENANARPAELDACTQWQSCDDLGPNRCTSPVDPFQHRHDANVPGPKPSIS